MDVKIMTEDATVQLSLSKYRLPTRKGGFDAYPRYLETTTGRRCRPKKRQNKLWPRPRWWCPGQQVVRKEAIKVPKQQPEMEARGREGNNSSNWRTLEVDMFRGGGGEGIRERERASEREREAGGRG